MRSRAPDYVLTDSYGCGTLNGPEFAGRDSDQERVALMGGSVRRSVLMGMGAVVFALGSASVAWACSAQSGITGSAVQGQSSGAAGSQIEVRITNFPPDPVSINWNSADGELLATGRGPDFATRITIPQVAEGVYYVVASGGQPGREQRASMSVEVTTSGAQQSGTGRSTTQVSSGTGESTASTSGDEEQATSSGQASTNRGGAVSSGPSGASVADPSSGSTPNAEPAGRATGTGTTAASASTERQSGAATASDSSAPGAPAPSGAQQSLATPAADATSAPTAVAGATASGDLWSGFSTADGTTPRGAGLTDDSSPAGTSNSLVAVGAFSVALVAMFGGFLTAEVRRRRVLAR